MATEPITQEVLDSLQLMASLVLSPTETIASEGVVYAAPSTLDDDEDDDYEDEDEDEEDDEEEDDDDFEDDDEDFEDGDDEEEDY